MNRRLFLISAAAYSCCLYAGKAYANAHGLPGTEMDSGTANPPSPAAERERFPVSVDEYKLLDAEYLPQLVDYSTPEVAGTIVIDTDSRFLYLVLGHHQSKRYGIGVGRDGFAWSGTATIGRKAKWPMWYPPKAMQLRDEEARKWANGMPGGPRNPLGARALYLYQGKTDTLFRIHGTRDPKSIGKAVSSGCIRMLNADVVELFDRVPLGTKVIVLPSTRPVARTKKPSNEALALEKKRRRDKKRMAIYRRYYRRRNRSALDWFRYDGW
ncbi:MAG TPA: L,D-transpeptidase [Nitrospiraceae bacterium]|nr:L,D-transpeptidase [Nitrospiraceae bacterium]